MEHSYRYRLRFGGPIWLPKLPSIFPRGFENFQAADRSISHARRYRVPKIATGNGTILVSLPMFYAGHRWYMWGLGGQGANLANRNNLPRDKYQVTRCRPAK